MLEAPVVPASVTDAQTLTLLVGRAEAARLCSVAIASWDRLTSRAGNPRPLRLVGNRLLWRRADLAEWVRLGCPDRETFEVLASGDDQPAVGKKRKAKSI